MSLIKLSQTLQDMGLEVGKLTNENLSSKEIDELKKRLEKQQKVINHEFQNTIQSLDDLQFEKAVSGEIRTYEIYTDGGARGNGNDDCVCAWGYYMITPHCPLPVEKGKAGVGATNQRMELIAILQALNSVPLEDREKFEVNLYSDSAYCINTLNDYIHRWVANNWVKSKGEIAHLDAWKQVYELSQTYKNINFIKVKGHSTNTGNNKVDLLVNLLMDEYETSACE